MNTVMIGMASLGATVGHIPSTRQSVRQRTDCSQNCAYYRLCASLLKISVDEYANSRPFGATKFTEEILCKLNT